LLVLPVPNRSSSSSSVTNLGSVGISPRCMVTSIDGKQTMER
jgi:hypothetical protein